MGFYEDMEAFRQLARDKELELNSLPDSYELDPASVYHELDEVLASIVGHHAVILVGEGITVPVVDTEEGYVEGYTDAEMVEGSSNGVFVVVDEDEMGDDIRIKRYEIGFSVLLPSKLSRGSRHESTWTTLMAYGPVATCRLQVPALEFPEMTEVAPDPDDPIYEDIDHAILNDPIDLSRLCEVFEGDEDGNDEGVSGLSDLQISLYEQYLDKTFSISDFSIEGAGNSVLAFESDGKLKQLLEPEYTLQFSSDIMGFVGFRYIRGANKLCFAMNGIMPGQTAYVAISNLTRLSMKTGKIAKPEGASI